jgi:hypothetical protein
MHIVCVCVCVCVSVCVRVYVLSICLSYTGAEGNGEVESRVRHFSPHFFIIFFCDTRAWKATERKSVAHENLF